MKKNLRILAILCSLALVFSALTACKGADSSASDTDTASDSAAEVSSGTNSQEPSEAKITDGYFEITADGIMQNFYRFKEDGTYYAKFFDGGVTDAGTYVLLDEEMQYVSDAGADGEFETDDDKTANAPQVIEVTSYLSGEVTKLAYDNNALCDINLGGMASHRTLEHKPEFTYVEEDMETAIPVITLYADNNESSTLTLYHNGSYVDYTGETGDEGTWLISGNGYTLTSESTPGQTGTITVSDNGMTGEYKVGDTALNLTSTIGETIATFTAEAVETGLPMGVDMRLDCNVDGTCQLIMIVEAVGEEFVIDSGTYTVADAFNFSFSFDTAGSVTSIPNYESATESSIEVEVPYTAQMQLELMGSDTDLSIETSLVGTVVVG